MEKRLSIGVLMVMCAVLFSSPGTGFAAQTDEGRVSKTVDMISAQGDWAYFSLVEGFLNPPLYNVCYIDLSTSSGRVTYATLLAVKTTGLKITRLAYDTAADGTCHVLLLQAQ